MGRAQSERKAAALAVLLRDHFLTADPAGGWHDRLDHDGACLSKFMPASTLYHLACAIDELSQFATVPPNCRPKIPAADTSGRRYADGRVRAWRFPWSRWDTIGFWIGHQMFNVGSFHNSVN